MGTMKATASRENGFRHSVKIRSHELTVDERAEPARHLAARFCAKEAVAKALALQDGDWHDVEVLGGGDRAPGLRLSGRAAVRAAELGVEVTVSLTHSKGMAAAVALLK